MPVEFAGKLKCAVLSNIIASLATPVIG